VTTVSVTCNVPAGSIVTFRPAVDVFDHDSHQVIPQGYPHAVGTADDTGAAALSVLPCDDPSVSPADFSYNVTVASPNADTISQSVQVMAANGATQYLDELLDG
jgi:hypothetical protein